MTTAGYPQLSINGENAKLHRWMYESINGPIAPGMHAAHVCDVKRCINPDHIEVATPQKNTQDAYDRGLATPWQKGNTHCPRGHEYRAPRAQDIQRRCVECARLAPSFGRKYPSQKAPADCQICGATVQKTNMSNHMRRMHCARGGDRG